MRLSIQIQPTRSPGIDLPAVLTRLMQLAPDARVTQGDDEIPYVNVDYDALELSGLWAQVQKELQNSTGLAEATIVVCEGNYGWDDYLLLHHYDPHESRDQLR